jgi:hypothetical protein
MTSVTGQTLLDIQSDYHGLVSRILLGNTQETLLFSHFGEFNQQKIDNVLKIVEAGIIDLGDKRQSMKRFCSVLIEALQNMSLHAAKDSSNKMHAYCVITRSNTGYRLFTGNLILSEDMDGLDSRLVELNSMDKNTLRKLFIETLCNEDFTNKGGAGLGLLTIAKRSTDALKYSIKQINKDFGYFQMEADLGKA